jgi:hypothetical protein
MQSLKSFDKLRALGLVSSMLLFPKFHANNFRIERLLHLLIAGCRGTQFPTTRDLRRWLNEYEPVASRRMLEDPPEDTFIGKVTTPLGDYRLYGGLWESHCFFLQRILNVIQTLPANLAGPSLIRPIYALLSISEEIARRNKARVNVVAISQDKSNIYPPGLIDLEQHLQTLYFNEEELNGLGYSMADIQPFILPDLTHKKVKDHEHGMTELVTQPLVKDKDRILVVLPTAISWAIRLFFFGWLRQRSLVEKFHENLVLEYQRLLWSLPTYGKYINPRKPLASTKIHDTNFVEFCVMIDKGRYMHLLLVIDTLAGLKDYGINNPPKKYEKQAKEVESRMKKMHEEVSARTGFREALSLVVMCGYGRARFLGMDSPGDNWDVSAIGAGDLETMAWMAGTKDKTIWRFVKHERRLDELNIELFNVNGLLNLFGWWEELDHMLVPSSLQVGSEKRNGILVPTNCIGEVRRKAWARVDLRSAHFVDGSFKQVRRKNLSPYFKEDYRSSLHVSLSDALRGRLLGCVLTKRRAWWISISEPSSFDPDMEFRTWDALHNWLGQIAKVLDRSLRSSKQGPVLFEIDMTQLKIYPTISDYPEESRKGAVATYAINGSVIKVVVLQRYLYELSNPKNVSEAAVIEAFVLGFLAWTELPRTELALRRLLSEIIPNDDARYIHAFQQQNFREAMRASIKADYEVIDKSDRSILWVGLGHFSSPSERRIDGKQQCTQYLNNLVDHLCLMLKNDLRRFGRKDLLTAIFLNIEAIAAERGQWNRTMKAVVNLRNDPQSVFDEKAKHFSHLSLADITCRILIEMGICECPLQGEIEFSKFDVSPLMAKAQMIFEFGNISDGISKDEIAPSILIQPNGDVQTDQSFRMDIFHPLIRQHEDRSTREAIDSYEELFKEAKEPDDIENKLEEQFLQAIKAEFAIDVEDLRMFLEEVEDIGYEKGSLLYSIEQTEILAHAKVKGSIKEGTLKTILDKFSLKPRSSWDSLPGEYVGRDLYPWLYRRRLSLMMKPVLRLDDTDNPEYLIAPGFCQASFMYVLNLYRGCEIEPERCNTELMKKWIGDESKRRGHSFVQKAAKVLRGFAYSVTVETALSAIFPKEMLDKNYGDFDLIAWKPGEPKVFLIECKKLFFAKTFRDMAEQLQEFKGVSRHGKDDRLKKHLNRIEIAVRAKNYVAKHCGLSVDIEVIPMVLFSDPVPVLYGSHNHEVIFSHLRQVEHSGL